MKNVKLRLVFYYVIVAVLLAVFIILVVQHFYLWVVASVVGFALLLVYERLRPPKTDDAEAEKSH